ncbi:MAG: rubrerythrin [Chloroflexi bacterium HGW-Chloroflexi-10]|nr:MAG: rubrerythrin [Chloroflexi bacterium HGW-Chloroflexi-10]
MSKSLEGLKSAFAGESQANRKYLAFAEAADKEGYPQVARLFRAAAHAETVHAITHLKTMGGVKTTLENLREAIEGENYEVTNMYPEFIGYAESEDDKKALSSFKKAFEVEKVHEELYHQMLDLLAAGHANEEEYEYYVCPVCGYTHARTAPEKCPVCGVPAERFEKIQ